LRRLKAMNESIKEMKGDCISYITVLSIKKSTPQKKKKNSRDFPKNISVLFGESAYMLLIAK